MQITVIVEKVYEGFPGEGYEAGVECDDGRYTQKGWYGKTPEEALARMLTDNAQSMGNLAGAVQRYAAIQAAIVQHMGNLSDWDTLRRVGPRTIFEVAGRFGASRIDLTERKLYEAERDLAALREVARTLAAVTPRPKPYYGSPIWALDQALGETGEAQEAADHGPCDCDECTAARNEVI